MHQPFGFAELGKGLGEIAAAPFQTGEYAVPDQHADVTAGAGLGNPGAQTLASQLWLQAQAEQITLIQGQPGTHRVQPLLRQPA
ncbi:hypothetical protein D9M68_866830 [compost metagenome]